MFPETSKKTSNLFFPAAEAKSAVDIFDSATVPLQHTPPSALQVSMIPPYLHSKPFQFLTAFKLTCRI